MATHQLRPAQFNPQSTAAQFLLALASLILTLPTTVLAASFNCSKATHPVEQSICADGLLSLLDERLAHHYGRKRIVAKNPEQFKADQQTWLKETRNKCPGPKCIAQAYVDRIVSLSDDQANATDPTSQEAYARVFIACDAARNFVLIGTVAYGTENNLFFEERGAATSSHEWRDLELVAEDQPEQEFPARLGSQTRDIVCGHYHVRIEYGFLNSDTGGFQGYESFPSLSLHWESEVLINAVPLGYWRTGYTDQAPLAHRYGKPPCQSGAAQAILAISPDKGKPPRAFLESLCFFADRDRKQRQLLEVTRP